MTMPDFEKQVVDALNCRYESDSGPLVIRLQQSGEPGPDIVIHNRESGRSLGIEIKMSSGTLPLSLYPHLKELSEESRQKGDDFIVLSNMPASGVLEKNASTAHISIVQVSNPEEAIRILEPRIRLLDQR